ncbi:hypothetical protein SAMN05444396_10531 [Flavobacterium segetis]|uniref:MetA-pathway of phenol degradation n=1 Tax=Flavobacterium segetis TaxID=271157 RepID=A0A1M5HDG0_9FLAO|nr:hypothetical protein [Flavobacterium segetis]SHG13996.1 hypothetical protein SAMN05444396_10531 [Flavobacterium segetis]
MIKKQLLFILAVTTFGYVNTAHSQSPISGFMQGKGKGNVSLSFSSEKYDEVYFIPEKVQGVPVFNETKITSTSIYATYGISNQVDVVLVLPYVTAKGNATPEVLMNLDLQNERKGFQDASVFIKYSPFYFDFGSSSLRLIGALGLKTPLGNYKVEEGFQSIIAIGNRSTTVSTTGMAMYKTNSGIFASAQLAGNYASNNVPNSYATELKIGFAAKSFYGDAFIANQKSTGGVDIFGPGFTGFFPITKVNYTKIGLNLYTPIYKELGVSVGASTLVAGRNIGNSTGYYGGLVYKF